jgi:hypothetical protein
MKKVLFVFMFAFVLTLAGCATSKEKYSKRNEYPGMYSESIKTIFVMPAINKTTAADAGELYVTSLAEPLTQKGFYVLPIPITGALMKQEGIVDGAQLGGADLSLYKKQFGADAVLFVTIKQWDTSYSVISGSVTVGVDFELKSTTDSSLIWHSENTVVANTSENANNGGWLAAIIVTAIKTATQDYMPVVRDVNRGALIKLPAGPYHAQYGAD